MGSTRQIDDGPGDVAGAVVIQGADSPHSPRSGDRPPLGPVADVDQHPAAGGDAGVDPTRPPGAHVQLDPRPLPAAVVAGGTLNITEGPQQVNANPVRPKAGRVPVRGAPGRRPIRASGRTTA
jgi:hypothetical protein